MSLHKDPVTLAEHIARMLEDKYALQLDAARHKALLTDMEAMLPHKSPNPERWGRFARLSKGPDKATDFMGLPVKPVTHETLPVTHETLPLHSPSGAPAIPAPQTGAPIAEG
jgi:hypothetical protein